MEFQVGETHSGYEFLDVLKRSKNSIEFRVRNTRFGRIEALRTVPEASQNPEQAERFLREMRVHAGLVHPNIVTLFGALEVENHLVITTELVEGPTVAERLAQGPLAWAEAVSIVRQVLAAAGYAHRHGIVHRNITPENIILGPDGIVKLANFALAKGAGSPKLTQIGVPIGNLKYISPEQIKGVVEVDGRSDLYSLGMVFYEMLCGRPAFVMKSEFELMAAHVTTAAPPPHEFNSSLPEELDAVVLKALAKNPGERFQSAVEFDDALVKVTVGQMLRNVPAAAKAAPPAHIVTKPAADLGGTAHNGPAPVPAFLAAPGKPLLSRQQILIGGAVGACAGGLVAVLWLLAK